MPFTRRECLAGSAAILCAGGLDVIRKEAWPFYRTSSGDSLCWELEEPKGPTESRKAVRTLVDHERRDAFVSGTGVPHS